MENAQDKLILDYFYELFTSSSPDHDWSFLNSLSGCLTDEMNWSLAVVFTKEMASALNQMYSNKAPGLDRMTPLFFINYWDIVGQTKIDVVVNALNSGIIPLILNYTFITLISKKKQPKYIADFFPISFCNILYKLVAKVLANRLKFILPKIISLSQSTFVPRRLISNNILVPFEVKHFLKYKKMRKI